MSSAPHEDSRPGNSKANRAQRREHKQNRDRYEQHGQPSRARAAEPSTQRRSRPRPRSRSPRPDYHRDEPVKKKPRRSQKERAGGSRNANAGSGSAPATFDVGDDFVAFAPLSEDELEVPRPKTPEREWDRGKGKRRSYDESESRRAPWVSAVDWKACNNVADMLHKEVEAYVKYISPTPVEDEIRGLVVQLVSKAITSVYKDAQVRAFGSFGTKLYLPQGDIDLVVISDSMAYSDSLTVLQALAATLKRSGITDRVTIIGKAKVPIVKFVTTYGRLNVDISVNQGNGLVAVDIVNRFLAAPSGGALKGLVLIIKAFLSQRGMNEVFTGGLGSYAIVCLAVSFLQLHPKLRRGEIDASKNLGVLVMEFFELYGLHFNYEQTGISVNGGGSYFNKVHRGWQNWQRKLLLSIEDPTDPSNDISKGSYAVAKVRTTFAGAFQILAAAAVNRASILRNSRDDQAFTFRGREDPEEGSILSAIIHVTQETINHRRLIQEVYDDRIFHDLLGVEPKHNLAPPDSKRDRNGHSPRAVIEAYETDMELDSDIEEGEERLGNRKRRSEESDELVEEAEAEEEEEEEEEEGRYDIGSRRQPPTKRRRVGTVADEHTVFTTDDDDDDDGEEGGLVVAHLADSEDDLEEYESDGPPAATSNGTAKRDEKRSYWLSKGIGIGTVDEDSD